MPTRHLPPTSPSLPGRLRGDAAVKEGPALLLLSAFAVAKVEAFLERRLLPRLSRDRQNGSVWPSLTFAGKKRHGKKWRLARLLKFKDSESEAADFFHSQFKTEQLKAGRFT